MAWNFLNLINFITVFQLLLFSFFLFSQKKGKKVSNRILAGFLLSTAMPLISFVLYRVDLSAYLKYPFLFWFGNSFAFLWGPAIYLYTRSLIFRNFSLNHRHAVHLIPYGLYWAYKIIAFYIYGDPVKLELLIVGKVYNLSDILMVGVFLHLLILFYMIMSLHSLNIYQEEIKEIFSSIEKASLSWLRFVILGFSIIWVTGLLNSIITYMRGSPEVPLCLFNVVYIFFMANFIVLKGLRQPEIFSGIDKRPKYERSTLSKSDAGLYLKQLKSCMEKDKPYLIPSLTVQDLSNRLSIQPRHLSQVINEYLHQNFMDFINSYRIKEAKRLLKNRLNEKGAILEILFEVGFNSKAAFNKAFKKKTGLTPSEYMKRNQVQ